MRAPAHVESEPSRPGVAFSNPLSISGWLVGVSLFLSAFGGGMLYDRVMVGSGAIGPMELIGTPLSLILISVAVLLSLWSPREAKQASSTRFSLFSGSCFALFLLWCGLSIARSTYLHSSVTSVAIFVAAFGAGIAVFRASTSRVSTIATLVLLVAAATAVSVFGVQEYVRELRGGNALWRVFSGFVNPDFLAGYLVMIVPVAIALLLISQQPYHRLASSFAVLLTSVCLVLTGSRLGLLTLVVTLIVFAVLAFRSGALSPQTRKVGLIAGVILLVGIVVAGRPLLRRLLSSGTESYSAQFRVRTWAGARKMAFANPIVGTGVGTFETAYAPYAVVGYTQHAHSSYFQLMGEIGLPGAALLAAGLLLVMGAGVAASGRPKQEEPAESNGGDLRIVAAGITAAVLAGALHNLTDSDIYIPANAIVFGILCGLVLALHATLKAPEPTAPEPEKRQPPKAIPITLSVVFAAVLVNSFLVLLGRVAANGAEIDSAIVFNPAGQSSVADIRAALESAVSGYQEAESRDMLNPEYPMRTASLMESLGRKEEAEAESRKAIARAAIGKTYYRYGKLLAREGRFAEAAKQHEQVRRVEPNNLDNLMALAEDYNATEQSEKALEAYRYMVQLSKTDFGSIRAVPELVEWQYGRAYLGLGQAELDKKEFEQAASDLKQAIGLLGEFWRQRHLLIAEIRIRPEERKRTADFYAQSLEAYQKALEALGKISEVAETKTKAAEFEGERAKEQSKPDASS